MRSKVSFEKIFSMVSMPFHWQERWLISSSRNYLYTAWKVSKYEVFSGPYFPVFEPEKTPYLDFFSRSVNFHDLILVYNKLSLIKISAADERITDEGW